MKFGSLILRSFHSGTDLGGEVSNQNCWNGQVDQLEVLGWLDSRNGQIVRQLEWLEWSDSQNSWTVSKS